MLGAVYETHVVKVHGSLLGAESYFFTPKVLAVKVAKANGVETARNKINKIIQNHQQIAPKPKPCSTDYSIDFKVRNPWQEILSTTSRKKRAVDAITVGGLRKKMKTESSEKITAPEHITSQALWDQGESKLQPLRNKIEFISSLDSNTHYKQYLRSLRHLKMKKMMLFKFASRMSDNHIGKMKTEIQSNEQLLTNFSFMDQTPRKNGEISREEKKKKKVEKEIHIYGPPPVKLGIKKGVSNNNNINNSKPVSNGKVSPAPDQPRSMPVIDLGLGESPTIKCEYPGRESVIALNIPMEEIVENNLVIDMKSEY